MKINGKKLRDQQRRSVIVDRSHIVKINVVQ